MNFVYEDNMPFWMITRWTPTIITSTRVAICTKESRIGHEQSFLIITVLPVTVDFLNKQAQENLQTAVRIANSPPLQPPSSESQSRLNQVESQMERLCPTLISQLANLKDLVEKTQHIESGLAQIDRVTKQAELWRGKLLSSACADGTTNNSRIFSEVSPNIDYVDWPRGPFLFCYCMEREYIRSQVPWLIVTRMRESRLIRI